MFRCLLLVSPTMLFIRKISEDTSSYARECGQGKVPEVECNQSRHDRAQHRNDRSIDIGNTVIHSHLQMYILPDPGLQLASWDATALCQKQQKSVCRPQVGGMRRAVTVEPTASEALTTGTDKRVRHGAD